ISPRCADPRAGARRRPPEGPRMTRAPGMAFAALAGATPQAQDRDWNGWASHPMWGMWGMWSVWGLMMMFLMLVFWGLVIAGVVDEELPESRRRRGEVVKGLSAPREPVIGLVGVLDPEREVPVAHVEPVRLDGPDFAVLADDDVELELAAQSVPDAREAEVRARDLH